MVSGKTILNNLPLFKNEYIEITESQSVNDIMQAIKKAHKLHAKDYDKIYQYFIGIDEFETCENIFDFLRANTKYFIESEEQQTVKSPAAILHEKNIDCKNYSLFAGGVLDAINRSGKMYIPYVYRFVSDSIFSTTPNHVFICAFPNDANGEIWIDAIPQIKRFNDRINFFYSTDKKYNTMLYSVSGVNNKIGFTINDAANVAQSSGDPVAMAAGTVVNLLANLFGNKPNPNDWMGWGALDSKIGAPFGTNAQNWVINDGDSVQNEALNIVRWIEANGIESVINYSTWFKRNITLNDLQNKLSRAGYTREAQEFKTLAENSPTIKRELINPNGGGTTKAGMNIYITLALVAAGIYFVTKKK